MSLTRGTDFTVGYGRAGLKPKEDEMRMTFLIGVACLATFAMPITAQAQGGIPGGAAHGYYEGGRIAGPVGAVVGTAVGGAMRGGESGLRLARRYYTEY